MILTADAAPKHRGAPGPYDRGKGGHDLRGSGWSRVGTVRQYGPVHIMMLGPFEVRTAAGAAVEVPGTRLRALLSALALEPGRVVTRTRLVDWIWGERPPADEANALQVLVSRLRRVLPEGSVEAESGGYRLAVAADAVDVSRFERLLGRARAADDVARRAELLRSALELWRGAALADIAPHGSDAFVAAATRLDELRLAALADRVDADIRLGRGAGLVSELTELVATHPLREGLVAALMRALAEAGRGSEALMAYQKLRERLVEALGVEPSAELSALHTALLRGNVGDVGDGADAGARRPYGERADRTSGAARASRPDRAPHVEAASPAETTDPIRRTPHTWRTGSASHAVGGAGPADRDEREQTGRGPRDGPAEPQRPRTNLRAGLTSFVGKDEDVAAVADLITEHRLVTLTGPGGSGKTRLAAETARRMLGDLPDGAWLVELASVRAGGELAQVVLTAIGLRDQALVGGGAGGDAGGGLGGDSMDRLVAAVRERAHLLVLDNCEHMIEAAAAFADRLLGECRGLRVLATSREPLGITGEALWQVEPLALPGAGADPDAVGASPAVLLLRDRAGAVRKDVVFDESTLAAMARICRALDGIPLAIELAAARLRTMSVEQLALRLDDRFRLLSSGSRTALPRHKTLRAVVDWSWDLLTEAERSVLGRLSVFSGGATLDAAERVCGGAALDGEQVLDVLTALIEKSLLLADDTAVPRYRMLDTIREYAAHRLAEAGETESARRAHLAYFTELTATAEPHLRRTEQLEWLAVLEAEHDNINAALRGAVADGWAHEAMRLVGPAGWYWFLSGRKAEGTELSVAAASLDGPVPDDVRAMAYAVVTLFLTSGQGDQYAAQDWIHEAYRFARRGTSRHPLMVMVDLMERMLAEPLEFLAAFEPMLTDEDSWVRAQARLNRSRLRLTVGRVEPDTDRDMEIALAEFRALGDRWGMSLALMSLADRLAQRGAFTEACAHYEQGITALTELGALEDALGLRARQAQLYWLLGDEAACEAAMAEAQACVDRVAWPDALAELVLAKAQLARWRGRRDEAYAHLDAARTLRVSGTRGYLRVVTQDLYGYLAEDVDEARGHWAEAFREAVKLGHLPLLAHVLVGVADLALRQGRHERAVALLAAGESVRGTPDRSLPDVDRITAAARARLGETAYADAVLAGRAGGWREQAEATLAG
ncbi:SARP family transcriptional regulator [Streptomyces alboflavus]|uniref:SARP family transcriptional regulator n=2 Tax=Streptomyces alboflavus TaxID=67267 RepID=A0A1Z1WM14_9ACTN|nr:SARP family transcriptional regulator [Streptomyces alboflavus]